MSTNHSEKFNLNKLVANFGVIVVLLAGQNSTILGGVEDKATKKVVDGVVLIVCITCPGACKVSPAGTRIWFALAPVGTPLSVVTCNSLAIYITVNVPSIVTVASKRIGPATNAFFVLAIVTF